MAKHLVEAEELQAYLDGELAAARQAEVGRHLGECHECAQAAADLKRVSATLKQWQVGPAPARLRPPVFVAEKPEPCWSWPRLALGLSGAVAVVLVIAAISIPNLLRSRLAVQQAGRVPVTSGAKDELEGFTPSTDKSLPRGQAPGTPAHSPRMIAYQVALTIEVKEFEDAKAHLQRLTEQAGGYIAHSSLAETPNQPRRADLTLRVPVSQLSTVLEQIRKLGRVVREQLSTEEVTEQVVDLEARLRNARATEQRLIAVLQNRTGKVRDILEVEQEIARTRQEIERMEAQRQHLYRRVELATLQVTLVEEFKAQLQPAPIGTWVRLRNAAVDGYESFVGSVVGLAIFLARYGLTLLFWGGLCWLSWRGVRRLAGARLSGK